MKTVLSITENQLKLLDRVSHLFQYGNADDASTTPSNSQPDDRIHRNGKNDVHTAARHVAKPYAR